MQEALELAGLALVSVAAFLTAVPLGLFALGVSLVLVARGLSRKGGGAA